MKIKLVISVIIIMLFMTSCARTAADTADEIRLNSWSAALQNGSVVTLSFKNDTAELTVKSMDINARASIKGLCFFDKKSMLIYDKKECEPYIFNYRINNNTLILNYSGGRMILTRRG